MAQILMATHNQWKCQLFRPIFQGYGFDVITLRDIPVKGNPSAEVGTHPTENALTKAWCYHSTAHPWVFGDDAGLEIDALNGEPGLQARRWNGRFPDDVDDQTWLDYLLERMKDVPFEQRTASFVSGWALIAPDGSEHIHEVRWPFRIALRSIRPISPGSPITSVRIGPSDDLERRRAEIWDEWDRWGILDKLLKQTSY